MTTKILTRDEWLTKTPPFSFMKISNATWSRVHRDIIVKWLEAHTGAGWVYWDEDQTYIFQSAGDQIAFSVWIKSNPFDSDDGEIDA